MLKSIWWQLLISIVLGAIAVFAYAPFNFGLLAFVSFTGLLLLVNQANKKRAALIGLTWGFSYFLAGAHWVYVSINQYGGLPPIITCLILGLFILYLSLYPIIFAITLHCCKKFAPSYSFKQLVLLAPIVWQLTEFIRGSFLNGFAWLQFGYSQLNLPLRSLFPIIGINGINLIFSCLCGLIAWLIYQLIQTRRQSKPIKKSFWFGLSSLVILFFIPLLGNNIAWTTVDKQRNATITLVQANIPQSIRWSWRQLEKTMDTYLNLTEKHLSQSDIIIWSEAAITDLESNQQQYLQLLDQQAIAANTAVAVGIIDLRRKPITPYNSSDNTPNYDIYNSLIVLGDKEPYQYPTQNRYNKHHLVPFGEYIPLASLLKPIADLLNIPMSSMSAGDSKQPPLEMKGFKFTTVICYEVILSNIVLNNFTNQTDFLLTVSNDAWFGDTIGPWQHLQMAQARALEFGRTLLRSTNNGITVVINPNGEIVEQLPQFTTDTLTTTLSPNTGLTPYARWGNSGYYGLLVLLSLGLFIRRKNRL